MPNFRRWRIPGASYFFTLVTADRKPLFWNELARVCLRNAIRDCRANWDFSLDAIVLLPDHWHAIITLPPEDDEYPKRLGWIKKEFTGAWLDGGGSEVPPSPSQVRQRRRGVWQERYWEHTILDEDDYEAHLDYVHFNPVKHGYVAKPSDWKWSTFQKWVDRGTYMPDRGTGLVELPKTGDCARDFGE